MISPIQPGLEFVSDMHLYEYEGRRLTSVTNAIKPLIDSQWFHDGKTWIGKCVHKACELDELGVLDDGTVDDITRPYLQAWRLFKAETGWSTLKSEMQLAHPKYKFAGCIDNIGFLKELSILDLKTSSSPARWWSCQTAGYSELVKFNAKLLGFSALDIKHLKRLILILRPNSTYKLISCESLLDELRAIDLFYSCLKIEQFKRDQM